jgi:hypothetical protein
MLVRVASHCISRQSLGEDWINVVFYFVEQVILVLVGAQRYF